MAGHIGQKKNLKVSSFVSKAGMLKLKTNDILSRIFFVKRKGIFLPTGGSLTASSSLYPQDANSTTPPPFVITEYILRQYLYEQPPPKPNIYTCGETLPQGKQYTG